MQASSTVFSARNCPIGVPVSGVGLACVEALALRYTPRTGKPGAGTFRLTGNRLPVSDPVSFLSLMAQLPASCFFEIRATSGEI